MLVGIISGIIAGLLLAWIAAAYSHTRVLVRFFGGDIRLARKLRTEGVTNFQFHRDDYGRTLRTYLEQAKHSIEIVSISLGLTHAEGNLIDLFRQKLNLNSFEIAISQLFRNSLPEEHAQRLRVLVHECLPMGSAILLDGSLDHGRIQIETKLHRAARVESFGFEIAAGTPFYERHFNAWKRVLHSSRPPTEAEFSDALHGSSR